MNIVEGQPVKFYAKICGANAKEIDSGRNVFVANDRVYTQRKQYNCSFLREAERAFADSYVRRLTLLNYVSANIVICCYLVTR